MNTTTNTKKTEGTTLGGFLRDCLAGILLAGAFVATGFGFCAAAHADDAPPNFDGPAAIAPALIAPWVPTIDQYTALRHVNCGFSGGHGSFQCSYG
jgi:hypothetical protein